MVVSSEEFMQYDARMNSTPHGFESSAIPSESSSNYDLINSLNAEERENSTKRLSSVTRRGRSSSTRAATNNAPNATNNDFFSRLRQYSLERKGKMVKFFRNGDQFFPGAALCISLDRYRCIGGLYEELNRVLGVSEYLDRGVRRLLSLDGKLLQSVEDVLEAGAAICSSNETLRKLDYAGIHACPQWKFSPSQMDAKRKDLRQRHGGGMTKRQTVRAEKVISPKRIVVFLHETNVLSTGASQRQQRPRKHLKLLLNEQAVNGGYRNFLRQVQQQFNTKYQLSSSLGDKRNGAVSTSDNHNNNNNLGVVVDDAAEKKNADSTNNTIIRTMTSTTTVSIRIFACYTPAGKPCATLLDLVRGGDENNCFIAFDERCSRIEPAAGDDSSNSVSQLSDDDFIIAYADALTLDADEMQILQEHTLTVPSGKAGASPQQLFSQNAGEHPPSGNIVGRCLAQARKQIAGTCTSRKRIAPVVVAHHAVLQAAAAAAARRPRSAQANFGAATVSSSVSSPVNIADVPDTTSPVEPQDPLVREVSRRKQASDGMNFKNGQSTLHIPPQQPSMHLSFKQPASRKISSPAAASTAKVDRQLAHPSIIAAAAANRQHNTHPTSDSTDTGRAATQNGRRTTVTNNNNNKRTTGAVAAVAGAAHRLIIQRTRAVSNNPGAKQRQQNFATSNINQQQQQGNNEIPIQSHTTSTHAHPATPTNNNNNNSSSSSSGAFTMPHPAALTSKYRVMAQIGTGNFADVHVCADVYDLSREYALKIIDKRKVLDKRNLSNECALLRKLGTHPNIVTLYEQYEFSNRVYLLMELVAGGDLFNYISQAKCLSERESATLITTLINGLHYLHTNGIVHRDVKPENLLVCCQNAVAGGEHMAYAAKSLKLCDFGLAVELPAAGQRLFTICGSPTYIAPEILHETGYDYQVDVWATGVITYIMLAGYPPFRGDEETGQEELFGQILDARYCFDEEYWCNVSALAKDLISRILVVNPYRRLTCTGVFGHEWIQNHLGFVPHQLSDSLLSSLAKTNLFRSTPASTSSSSASTQSHRVHFLPNVFPSTRADDVDGRKNPDGNRSSGLKSKKLSNAVVNMDEEQVVPGSAVSNAKNYRNAASVPDVIAAAFPGTINKHIYAEDADLDEFSPDAALLCATPTNSNVELQRDMFAFGDADNNNVLHSKRSVAAEEATVMDDEPLIF